LKKLLSFLLPLILLSFAITLVNCGDSSTPTPTTLSFAYLTETPAGTVDPFQPVIGTISGSAFTANPVKDPSTGNAITGEFLSIAMSPDGKKGVVSMPGENSDDIYVGLVDGSTAIPITNDDNFDGAPTFTADSANVLFLSSRGTTSGWDTMKANISGTITLTNLTADSPICHHEPAASPDGTKIAFSGHGHTETTYFYDVYVMNADGTNPVKLTNSTDYDIEYGFPSYSPDSKQITYTRGDWTQSPVAMDIFVMNADGTNPKQLTSTGTAVMSRFLADGTITFMQYQTNNWEIFRMNADGTNVTRLTNNTVYDGFSIEFIGWSQGSMRPSRTHQHPQLH
jgi:Tol biopolymer transport system component